MALPTRSDLEQTYRLVHAHLHRTPVLRSRSLDALSGARLFFKCENFQRTGSFKMRGALNALLRLDGEQKARGVATHSSGNFAQALALAAHEAGVPAFIVMPENAPAVKRQAVEAFGGRVFPCGPALSDREARLREVLEETGATFIHPSDDLMVILGQGTAAMELLEDQPDLEVIIAPVGGGGLLAGSALAAHHFGREVQVLAGEPRNADDAWQSLRAGRIIPPENPQTIADGLRTALGEVNFPIIQRLVSDIIRVEEEEILHALKLLLQRLKIVVEPSSAVAFAAVLKEPERFRGKRVGVLLSGGNLDWNVLTAGEE